MRRNAIHLAVVSLTLMLCGCSLFRKKESVVQMEPALGSLADYTPPIQESSYPVPDPYPVFRSAEVIADAPTSADISLMAGALSSRYHTVSKGDTLYALARRYYNDQRRWKEIYQANRSGLSDPDRIRIGQRLMIP